MFCYICDGLVRKLPPENKPQNVMQYFLKTTYEKTFYSTSTPIDN